MLAPMARHGIDIAGWLRGNAEDHDRLWSLNERANHCVRWGHGFHIASACCFFLSLALPISFTESSAGALFGITAARLWATWRLYPALLKRPLVILGAIYILYSLLGLLWTPNLPYGIKEVDAVRWFLLVPALWPLRHLRRWFILCAIASYSIAYSAQFIQALAFEFGWEHLDFDAYPNRISCWFMPASAGSIFLAAFGLHLPIALDQKHPLRWPARAMAILATLSVIATGARGAWIAGALFFTLTLLRAIWRSRHRVRVLITGAIIAIVALPIAWIALGEQIQSRIDEGRWEIKEALENKDYSTSTGARINMWIWAGRAFAANPILGTGTGGYEKWSETRQAEMGISHDDQPITRNAHGAYVHIAASQGLVGLVLFGAMIAAFLLQCWPRAGDDRTYQAGLVGAVIAVLFAGIFATVHLHTQTAAVLSGFAALSMRPSNRT